MEKYGTYNIYKNVVTGELKRVPINSEDDDLVKLANNSNWEKLDRDPEEKINDR